MYRNHMKNNTWYLDGRMYRLVPTAKKITDWQEDIIDIDELEKAVYHYVEFYGDGGELHERGGVATMIESMVFTKEKTQSIRSA